MKWKSFLFLALLSWTNSFCQDIKSVQLFNPQTNDLTPFINKSSDYLILSFDEINGSTKRYNYKITRYNRNWEPSTIFTSEYLIGYDSGYIRDYRSSFNTRVPYIHYELTIPNKDFKFKLSGNYTVQVIDPSDNNIIVEKRFSVYDEMTNVGVKVDRNNSIDGYNQRVSVQVNSPTINLLQNSGNSLLVLLKNNNWNESYSIENPTFSQPNQFTYNQLDLAFSGGTEYQWFDTKNLNISALTTEKTILDDVYHTVLYPIIAQPEQTYTDQPDVDGHFFIRSTQIPNQVNSAYEADYTNVYFALSGYTPASNEEVFLYGAFNDFSPTKESILTYNNETNLLEGRLLLKQGYYNYNFGVRDVLTGEVDYNKIMGSHWQTENLYNALFYYQPWGERYDLLIGYGEGYSRPNRR